MSKNNTIELTEEEAYCIFFDDIEMLEGTPLGNAKIVEDGDWEDDGKYDFRTIIFELNGKFYQLNGSRTGSYYTDWDYNIDKYATEVTKSEKIVTIIEWNAVPNGN